MNYNKYYDYQLVNNSNDDHRNIIGGMWDELGSLQYNFLKEQGLNPNSTLLDIGCGSFRAGIHFVKFLNKGNYYATDVNEQIVNAGYTKEIDRLGLSNKFTKDNIQISSDFDLKKFNTQFDYIIAQSVFSHLPSMEFKKCLQSIREKTNKHSSFFATFFICPNNFEFKKSFTHELGRITTFPNKDPFHYTKNEIESIAEICGWKLEFLKGWNHPRSQKMAKLTHS